MAKKRRGSGNHKEYGCAIEFQQQGSGGSDGHHDGDGGTGAKKRRRKADGSAGTIPAAYDGSSTHLTNVTFGSLPISSLTKRAIAEVLGFRILTKVQHETLPVILKGGDVLAKAKTGTGKTLAFLVPTIEVLVKATGAGAQLNNEWGAIVMSPTRELATQIAAEAGALLTFHVGLSVACVVGGTNLKTEQRRLEKACTILVATPGRLLDHLGSTPGASVKASKCRVLVYDEADRMLDMGFKPTIDRIVAFLPPRSSRQTLLFSATTPPSLADIAKRTMRPGSLTIDTVGDEAAAQCHEHVPQSLVIAELDQLTAHLVALVDAGLAATTNAKVIVFFITARATGLIATLANRSGSRGAGNTLFADVRCPILEIHSRKSQSARQKASDAFRTAKRAVLLSSDVSARGLDYPDVTLVVQVGLTDRESYIHRVGRTARAGKAGRGTLLLCSFEERAMSQELKGLPVMAPAARSASSAPGAAVLAEASKRVAAGTAAVALDAEAYKAAEQAYQAWLGFYNGSLRKLGWSKSDLVLWANHYAQTLGLPEPPTLDRRTVGKMGLNNVPGLRVL